MFILYESLNQQNLWLSFFSKRTPAAYFAFVIVALLILSIAVMQPILQYLNGQTSITTKPYQLFIPIICLLLSMFCNRVFAIADTFDRATLWPGYMFILITFGILDQTTALQVLCHGSLGLLMLYDILKIQYNSKASKNCYNLGLYIGIAFIIDGEMLLMSIFLLYAISHLKPLNFKEYAMYALGLLTPLYFLFAYSYLIDNYNIWNSLLPYEEWFQFDYTLDLWTWIQWGIVIISMLITLFISFIQFNSLPVYIRRLSSALLHIIGATIIVAMISGFSGFLIFYLAPAFAFFATMLMLKYSNRQRQEVIHIIFVMLIIGIQLISNFL